MSVYQFKPPFTYHRDSEGCNDLWMIEDADGIDVVSLRFWDDVPRELRKSERLAKRIVEALNAAPMSVIMFGRGDNEGEGHPVEQQKGNS